MGTISMLAVDAGADPEVPAGLDSRGRTVPAILRGERSLCGGTFPLNPFYWGLYGGSEGAGIPAVHLSFRRRSPPWAMSQ